MKKLKIFTGLTNFIAAILIIVFAFNSLSYASKYMPEGGSWPTFFLATVYTAFEIVFCIIAFLQIIFALYYMFAHPRVRSFYAVGCVFCALDITSIAIICYLAVFITREITVLNYALVCVLVGGVQLAGIILKVICLFKFKSSDPDGSIAAEQKKLKKAEREQQRKDAVRGNAKKPTGAKDVSAAKPVKKQTAQPAQTEQKPPEKGADTATDEKN